MMVTVRADERGGIIISWLFKLVLSLAIVGAVAFEAGAIVVAHVNADTAANEVSGEAAVAASNGGSEGAAQAAARVEAAKQGVRLIGVSLSVDGSVVTVIVEKTAGTLLVHRLSFAKSWTVVRVVRRRAVPQ